MMTGINFYTESTIIGGRRFIVTLGRTYLALSVNRHFVQISWGRTNEA